MKRFVGAIIATAVSSTAGAVTITTSADWEQSFDGDSWVEATVCADDASAFCPAVPAPEPGGDAYAYFRVSFAADPLPLSASVHWAARDANAWVTLNDAEIGAVINGYFTHSAGRAVQVSLLGADNVLQFTLSPRPGAPTESRLSGSFVIEYTPPVPEPATWGLFALGLAALASRHRIPHGPRQ